jgi:hypothetical protein
LKTADKYLLICGAPKCGTTSLFRYLSDHPDICPSNRKETYFFAREFILNKVCQCGETLKDFESYFSHCPSGSKLRLEGTPYTLYAKDAARKISSLLQNSTVLFILRDPVQRLISDYNFSIQRGHVSAQNGTFQSFLDWQKRVTGDIPSLIDMGCYIRFVQSFYDVLGKDRVIILFFEELVSNQAAELDKLCLKLGIEDSFYEKYNFSIHNPTVNYRSSELNRLYIRLEPVVANMRKPLMNWPVLHKLFEKTIDFGKSIYWLVNNQKSNNREDYPPELLEELANYYQPYNKALSEVLARPLPWKSMKPVKAAVV